MSGNRRLVNSRQPMKNREFAQLASLPIGIGKGNKKKYLDKIIKINIFINMKEYLNILKQIREERGEKCEACGAIAKYIHHIIPVSKQRIHHNLMYEPANMIILCDDCHALMHPLLRNVSEWKIARKERGQTIARQR